MNLIITTRQVYACIILGLTAAAPATQASILINAGNQAYSQNFDTLLSTGTANTWSNDSTLPGWNLFNQTASGTAITTYAAGTGSSSTGAFYSFGNSADRALGGVGSGGAYFGSPASGALAGWIAADFTNNSGLILNGFTLTFDGEQWRNGGNTTAQAMKFEYGFGSSFTSVNAWNAPGGNFDWTSPVASATAGALDGNAVANRLANLGGTIATNWNAGDTLWLRWVENNDVGNDHGLAIDNVSFTSGAAPAPVPLPPASVLMAAALAGLSRFRRRTLQQ